MISAARRWAYVEPGGVGHSDTVIVMTEADIIAEYFPYWRSRMADIGQSDLISEEACIENWVVVHWAAEVK